MYILFILTSLSQHCSVLFNIVLAILRTINMYFPFYRLKRRVMLCLLAALPIIYLIITVYELYFYRAESYFALFSYLVIFPAVGASLTWSVSIRLEELHQNPLPEYSHVIVSLLLPFVLPSVVSVICFVLQAAKLLKKCEVGICSNKTIQAKQRNITITILLLTVTSFLCNTTFFTTSLVLIFGLENWERQYDNKIVTLMYVTSTVLPFVNSLINPLIFLGRGAKLRQFLMNNAISAKTCVVSSLYALRNNVLMQTQTSL